MSMPIGKVVPTPFHHLLNLVISSAGCVTAVLLSPQCFSAHISLVFQYAPGENWELSPCYSGHGFMS